MSLLHRDFAIATRSASATGAEVDVVASTGAVDSFGESIDPRGWELVRYQANPVVLLGHQSSSLPIGRASNVRVDGDALRATLHIVDEKAHPDAALVRESIRQGAMRAVSVGFRSLERGVEKRGGADVTVHKRSELIELSLVAVPANPAAVIEAVRSFNQREKTMNNPNELDRYNLILPVTKERLLRHSERTWGELSIEEKHDLWTKHPSIARAMREQATERPYVGKTYDELSFAEKALLANHEPDRYAELRASHERSIERKAG